MRRLAWVGLVLLICRWPAAGQELHRVLQGAASSPAGVGDLDGDGIGDLAAGNPGSDMVLVWSGLTGELLVRLPSHAPTLGPCSGGFGSAVAGAGDVDIDGFPDLVVGHSCALNPASVWTGSATIFSGRRGLILKEIFGTGWGEGVGSDVSGLGDVDGDGSDDVIVVSRGKAKVHAGPRLNVLYAYDDLGTSPSLSVDRIGDVDSDGTPDILVGAPEAGEPGLFHAPKGEAYVFSGADGGLIHLLQKKSATVSWFGTVVASGFDADGDGVNDVAVSGPSSFASRGVVAVYSGAGGGLLFEMVGDEPSTFLGTHVAGASDVDGDGLGDILITGKDAPVHVIRGSDFSVYFSVNANAGALASTDADGDGYSDLVLTGQSGPPEVLVYAGHCGVIGYGEPGAGSGGFHPKLATGGTPAPDHADFAIHVIVGLGQAPGTLFVASDPASIPTGFGTFLVDPSGPLLPIPFMLAGTIPGTGWTSIPLSIPNIPALGSTDVYAQALIVDPGSSGGFSHTQGLRINLCQ